MNATNQSLSSSKDLCFRVSSIIHDDYVVLDYFSIVLATIINLLTCPVVVLLNALVITAIRTKARLQTQHNILLACSVAVKDLVVGIGAQPAFITQEIMVLVGGSSSLPCSLYNIIQRTILCLLHVSFLHLAVISLERFVAMKYSLRYEEIVTKFRLIVAIVFCWVVATFNLLFFKISYRNRICTFLNYIFKFSSNYFLPYLCLFYLSPSRDSNPVWANFPRGHCKVFEGKESLENNQYYYRWRFYLLFSRVCDWDITRNFFKLFNS